MLKKIPLSIINHTPLKNILQDFTEGVIPVFMLHRIDDSVANGVPTEKINAFLIALKKHGYEFIGLEELCTIIQTPGEVLKNKVLFTMDDGYVDQVTKGVPIFQKHDCPVTIAIITNFISGTMWPWDAKIRYIFKNTKKNKCVYTSFDGGKHTYIMDSMDEKLKAMRNIRSDLKNSPKSFLLKTLDNLQDSLNMVLPVEAPEHYRAFQWEDVKRLEGDGVNFIPHTQNHYILSNLSDDEAKIEIEGSIRELKKHIPSPVPAFIYPNGRMNDFNDVHMQILRENGIKFAFTTYNSYLSLNELDRTGNEPFQIPRIDFPINKNVQHNILTKIDYIANRFRDKNFSKLVEMTYGIKRTAIAKRIENLTRNPYLQKVKNIDPDRVKRIVFICVGNICRSPFAEAVAISDENNLQIISMGLEASGIHSPDPVAIKVSKEFGYNMEHFCSSKFDAEKLTSSDLLVVMEIFQLKMIDKVVREVGCQVTLLGAWDDPPSLSIDDPFGRTEPRFRVIFSKIKSCVHNLIVFVNNNNK